MNKITLYLLCLLLVSEIGISQEYRWESDGDMRFPVAGGLIFGYSDIIYVGGGYSEQLQINVDWLQKFNISQSIWKIIGNMQTARYGLSGGIFQDTSYISGGVHDNDPGSNSLETWDYGTSILSQIADSADNFNRIFAAGIIVNGKYYLFGGNPFPGNDSLDISYIVEYDLLSRSITYTSDGLFSGSDLPEQQMIAAIGNDIFLFGGVQIGISQKIYKFSTINRTFEELSLGMSVPRAAGSAVYFDQTGEIYIIGGYNETYTALSSVDVFSFDGVNYSIKSGPDLNTPRSHLMAINLENSIYAMGGYNLNGEVLSEIEKLIPATTSYRDTEKNIPEKFELFQNYPNPFNPNTVISFYLAHEAEVELSVVNLNGEEIANPVNGKLNAGLHEVTFDSGSMPSGVYIYRLTAGSYSQSQKMLLLK